MKLVLRNLHTEVLEATEHETQWLTDVLAWEDPRAFHRARATGRTFHAGDGTITLYDHGKKRFPSGYLPSVRDAASKDAIAIEVSDQRAQPAYLTGAQPVGGARWAGWLRDYQRDAVDAAKKRTRGIIQAPTGAGKTEVFAALSMELPVNWLFIMHRTTLVHQAAQRIALRTGEECGVIAEGVYEPRRVTCATFQSLVARRGADPIRIAAVHAFLTAVEAIGVDECHTLPADTFYRVAMSTPRAYYRIGVSATPLARGDQRSLYAVGALGPIIYRIRPDVLIAAGVLARPDVVMHRMHCDGGEASTPQGVYTRAIAQNSARNRAVVQAAKAADKPALVFVQRVAHGKKLLRDLEKAGLRARFVYGKNETSERQTAVKDLERGDLDVVVCSVVFQEGLDIPGCRSVIVASGGASTIAALQRIGRGMRVSEGKTTFSVVDFLDEGHPWPTKHARKRKASYEAEGYAVRIEGTAGAALPKKRASRKTKAADAPTAWTREELAIDDDTLT